MNLSFLFSLLCLHSLHSLCICCVVFVVFFNFATFYVTLSSYSFSLSFRSIFKITPRLILRSRFRLRMRIHPSPERKNRNYVVAVVATFGVVIKNFRFGCWLSVQCFRSFRLQNCNGVPKWKKANICPHTHTDTATEEQSQNIIKRAYLQYLSVLYD